MNASLHRRSLLALAAVAALAPAALAAPARAPVPDEMSMGAAGAPVTVVEYGSVGCPICAEFNNAVFPGFKKKYIDTGKVRYVFREALTGNPALASSGFLLARCAGKANYFKVVDAVFRAQSQMFEPGTENLRPGVGRAIFSRIATSVGVNEARMKACLTDAKAVKALNDRVERLSKQENVEATPTFIVNGAPYEGYLTAEQFDDILRPLLKSGGR